MTNPSTAAVLIVGAAACATDLHSRRIPNWLTFGATALALAVHVAVDGRAGAQVAMGGWVTGLFLFMPLFLLGGMGAGDVKLLAALGAWLGAPDTVWLAIYASMAGGVIAAVLALRSGYLRTALQNIGGLARFWWLFGVRPMPAMTLEQGSAPRLAYAVPMFLGTLVTLWLH
ncbi:MAG TPA: A24 family peptidase [Vicinamibacterales bacterium]|jgi:prepilin peptidase CpaA|nr:A24 family peptidase [Vicinamibacterales bacterium]